MYVMLKLSKPRMIHLLKQHLISNSLSSFSKLHFLVGYSSFEANRYIAIALDTFTPNFHQNIYVQTYMECSFAQELSSYTKTHYPYLVP